MHSLQHFLTFVDQYLRCGKGEFYCEKAKRCLTNLIPIHANLTARCQKYNLAFIPEAGNSTFRCPAHYACRGTGMCIHKDMFCDGHRDCKHGDDENEMRCAFSCPEGCSCSGIKLKCKTYSFMNIPLFIPHIDLSGDVLNMSVICEQYRTLLIYLNLSRTGIDDISCLSRELLFPALHTLDLSRNNIIVVPELHLPRLSALYLDGNPIIRIETTFSFYELYLSNSNIVALELQKTTHNTHSIMSFRENSTNKLCSLRPVITNCTIHHLDLSGNKLKTFEQFQYCKHLLSLDLQQNEIDFLSFFSFNGHSYLRDLNLQKNSLTTLSHAMFFGLSKLLNLRLNHNRISTIEAKAFNDLHFLEILNMSNNLISEIELDIFKANMRLTDLDLQNNRISSIRRTKTTLGHLRYLNLRQNRLKRIPSELFKTLSNLRSLDLRDNDIIGHGDMFTGLGVLEKLYVDSFTICCFRPASVPEQGCDAPVDVFSSCANLIDVGFLHICIWFTAILSITGNILALTNRIRNNTWIRESRDILVTNLCISDLLMGVYLIIVAYKDVITRGKYGYYHDSWLGGNMCKLAGAFVTVSSEMSTLCVFAITVDRYILFKYPFSPRRRARLFSILAVAVMWIFTITVAILPISLTEYFGDAFYGRSSVCVSLPLTRITLSFKAWQYSVGLFIMFNLVIYCLVVAGQVKIFMLIKSYSVCLEDSKKKQREIAVAKSLSYVVISDTLCWLPIAVLGIYLHLS